jgi:hypothetical protein
MFEPKTLYQAYNLARLQENTISHRQPHPSYSKNTYQTTGIHPSKPFIAPNNTKTTLYHNNNTTKSIPYHQKSPSTPDRPTKTLRNKELDERRAKGLCFWCDEKFIPVHRCRNKRVYSLLFWTMRMLQKKRSMKAVRLILTTSHLKYPLMP